MSEIKIVLVNDEKTDAMDIKRSLKSLNYHVPFVASSGEEALSKILEIMPDLILIDIMLKGDVDAFELASKIKNLNIPILFLTARAEKSAIERAMIIEPPVSIVKSSDPDELKFSIEHTLFQKEKDRETSWQISLTTAMNRVLKEALNCNSVHEVARICLDVASEFTHSAFGFIGEVNPEGRFNTIAISDSGWNNCIMPKTQAENAVLDMELQSYWSRPIKTGKTVMVNDPTLDPDQRGEPPGHPKITSFMGVPLKQGSKTVGMIAMANKESGYTLNDQKAMETLSVTIIEVISRKKAEITLQRSEERFRVVAESAVDGIVTTNLEGNIQFFNHSLEKIFGYHRAELIGKPLTTLMPDRYKDTYLKELERFKNSGYHRLVGKTVVTTGLKKDGTEFPFEMSLSSWKSGEKFYFTSIIRDLTSKIKAEEELQWSQERLKMGMDMASLAYWEYDIESDLFTFDDQFYALYGTTAEQEGGYQMTPQEYSQRFIPSKHQSIVAQEVGRALETDDPQFSSTAQHTIIRRDGEERYIIVRIRVVMDKDGRKIGTRGVNQDITELKMAEKALKESDRRLADIIDFLPDATFVIDKMGRVISWNRAIEEMTGVRADEILGKGNYEYSIPFYGLRRPILVDMVKAEDKEIREHYQIPQRRGEVLTAETEALLRGETRAVWAKAVPLYDSKGNFVGAIEAIRDINEMKQSRRKIRRELEINRALANIYAPIISPVSTMEDVGRTILNEAQKLTNSPQGFVSILDTPNDNTKMTLIGSQFLNGKDLALHLARDDSYNELWDHILHTIKPFYTNTPHEHLPLVSVPEGHFTVDSLLSVPVVLAEELVGQISVANAPEGYNRDDLDDISRLAVFCALAIQNKRAEQEIKQSLQDKEVLLREIHHRVKNNMQIISSLLNLQIRHVDGEQETNILKESQGRVKSMAMVHEKLYQSPTFTKIDFKDYAEKLINDIFYSYGVRKGTIETEIDVEDIHIGIDTAIPCGLIINELVTNSVKYAFPDNQGTLQIRLKTRNDHLEMVIADNGIGLPENLDYENTDSLGLQLVNNLVRQLDGQITLDRSKGTSFTISFQELHYKKRI